MMNLTKLRNDFSIFAHRPELIYADNAATTQKPHSVIQAMSSFYERSCAPVHRSVYQLGEDATSLYEGTRKKVAQFINAAHSSEIIFTSGTTESINNIASSWALKNLKAADEIVITAAEHHANLLPWQHVVKNTGAQLIIIPYTNALYGEDVLEYITPRTKILSVSHYSNMIGALWQTGALERLIEHAQKQGAFTLVDCAQTAPFKIVDAQKLNADALAFSGHKMLAPNGVGVLYLNKRRHHEVDPWRYGGSMVYSTTYHEATYQKAPQKYEAGTPSVGDVIGLGAAIDYLNALDTTWLNNHTSHLCTLLVNALKDIDGLTIAGNNHLEEASHLVSFTHKNVHAHDLAAFLWKYQIAVRAGHHCAQPFSTELKSESSVRASFYIYNTTEDVIAMIAAIKDGIKTLGNM